jgi:hypothetical protein
MPNMDVGNWSFGELRSLANASFGRWDNASTGFSGAALLSEHYSAEMAEGGAQKVYDALSSDLGTVCGQLRIMRDLAAPTPAGAAGAGQEEGGAGPRLTTPPSGIVNFGAGAPPRSLRYAVTVAGPAMAQQLGIASQEGYLSRFAYHEFDLIWWARVRRSAAAAAAAAATAAMKHPMH